MDEFYQNNESSKLLNLRKIKRDNKNDNNKNLDCIKEEDEKITISNQDLSGFGNIINKL